MHRNVRESWPFVCGGAIVWGRGKKERGEESKQVVRTQGHCTGVRMGRQGARVQVSLNANANANTNAERLKEVFQRSSRCHSSTNCAPSALHQLIEDGAEGGG